MRQKASRKSALRQIGSVLLAADFKLISCFDYSSTPKMGTKCSFETSVDLQQTTRHGILEDMALHMNGCENLKPYNPTYKKKSFSRNRDIKTQFVPHRRHIASPLQSPAG
jgi:hypothetical protein